MNYSDMSDNVPDEMDEIDRRILEILANDPRSPYADIADELAEHDIDLSSEGVRRRVKSLLANMTSFFLPRPDQNSWEMLLVAVRTTDEAGAKQGVFKAMSDMDFWFVADGFGTIDLYAVATAQSTIEIEDILLQVRELESVTEVDHFIETDREVNIRNYLPVY